MDYYARLSLKTFVEPTSACTGSPSMGDVNQFGLPSQEKKRGSCMS
jgi:hypothetical protein